MSNMNCTVNMDEGVVLNLSTYNELYSKARMLDVIVEDTLSTVTLEPTTSTYTKIRVDVFGALALPAYIMNRMVDGFVSRLANDDPDYIRSLVEADVHIFDFRDFSFKAWRHEDNTLEVDLLKHTEFRRRWDEETKKIEAERLAAEANNEEEDE